MNTSWENLFKVRIANPDDSFQKHEVCKLLIVMKILKLHKRKFHIRLYTEHPVNSHKCDIYFEDWKSKAVYIYEIQKAYSNKWLTKQTNFYNNFEVLGFNSVNFVPINLKDCPDNIQELNKELDKYIV